MRTSEMAIEMKKTLDKLVGIFLDRNLQYTGEEEWAANFTRSAELNRILRIDKIITKSYGKSLSAVVDKIDRTINGVLLVNAGEKGMSHIGDSIDDAIVYLFISKMLLKEEKVIE